MTPSDGGTGDERAGYGRIDQDDAVRANRRFWTEYAPDYLNEHGAYLGECDLLWCPEGLRESDAHLLGDVRGRAVLEVGCGAAQGSRWVAAHGGRVVGVDLSDGMLTAARRLNARHGAEVPLVQADALHLPFAAASFDVAFTAFGAIPFVADLAGVHREVARVLSPGGRWVFATSHPIRWAFPDDPTARGLRATRSYFDRAAYRERGADGQLSYAEFHHTLADHVSALTAAGFRLDALHEPEWTDGVTHVWGGWSPLRGTYLPGTLILTAALPA